MALEGFLTRVERVVRKWVDEPSTSDKYSSSDVVDLLRYAYSTLFVDLMLHEEGYAVVRYDLPVVDEQQVYVLPPNVGLIKKIERYDADTDRTSWEIWPSTIYANTYAGFYIEGNTLRISEKVDWGDSSNFIRVLYTPNAEIMPHIGAFDASTDVSTDSDDNQTVVLPASVTSGALDTRPHAYAGYLLRVLGSTESDEDFVQERMVKSYDHETRTATLASLFDPVLDAGTVTYEMIPVAGLQFEKVLALSIARTMLAMEGHERRKKLADQEYREAARAWRLTLAKEQTRLSGLFDGRTPENPNSFINSWGILY